ncbi:Thioredoxin-like protein AAED1, chloroplastic [Cucurbita argyrosperma subsp. argyrosperma]|nr:Thioredoxin-like protein AAED1, chloroplastic [Cucurbita argyrosperma subsp. argyrosperma]
MAATLSASPTYSSAAPQRKSSQSPRVFYNSSHRNLLFNSSFSHCNNTVKLSLERAGIVVSAVSDSPGIGSYVESGNTADLLDSVKVFDLNGNGIPISDLWKDRKAVVAFARHFGCVFCRKRADYLASKKAKAFSEQTKFQGEVYADPAHSSYEALNFVSGFTTTFTPKAGLKIIELYMEGYRQDWNLSFQKDTVSRGGWIKKLGMIQISKKFSRLVAHEVERDSHTALIHCHLRLACNKVVI